MKRLVLFIFLASSLTSCVPTLIGAGAYKSSKDKKTRQEFDAQLQATNIERESKGLRPLDWCAEAYKLDKQWAKKDKVCKNRIYAYEKGEAKSIEEIAYDPELKIENTNSRKHR